MVARLTYVMRVADKAFESVGGSTRHHVRDCLMPAMESEGLEVVVAGELSQAQTDSLVKGMTEARNEGLVLGRAEAVKASADLFAALESLALDIAEQVDVEDGSDGPRPNWAMRLLNAHGERVNSALERARGSK